MDAHLTAPTVRRRGLLGLAALLAGTALLITAIGPLTVPAQGMIRLRVVANSNSPTDQAIKLAVRDALVADLLPGAAGLQTEAAARAWITERLDALQAIAADAAYRAGAPASQKVTASLGPDTFPVRHIGWFVFPAGRYTTLRVGIGAAKGHNWWTVLFPPLAFVQLGQGLAVVGPSDGQGTTTVVSDQTDGTSVVDSAAAQWLRMVRWLGLGGQAAVSFHPESGDILIVSDRSAAAVPVQIRLFLWDLGRGVQDRLDALR
jgi:stage II sporulation protein R